MTDSDVEISVVIPNWNGMAWLPGCLTALSKQRGPEFETVLVDNGSVDGSAEKAAELMPGIRVIKLGSNQGFAAAVNEGIRQTSSPLIALLNSDTVPEPDWLVSLVSGLNDAGPDCGSAASLMLNMDKPDTVENAGDLLTRYGLALKRGHGMPVHLFLEPAKILSACAGAALYRRSMFEETYGFDESFFAYLEDMDMGLRARLFGFSCVYVPNAKVRHKGHGSNMPKGRYARLIARNRLMLLYKNLPTNILKQNLPQMLLGTFLLLAAHRRPFHTLAGFWDFFRTLPELKKQREFILKRTRISESEINGLFFTRTAK